MSNIFKKIKEQQDRNKSKELIETGKVFEYTNRPIPKPQPIRLINTGFYNIDTFRYRVFTKYDFIRYFVNNRKAQNITKNTFKVAEKVWNDTRKGYNFVIAAGNEVLMFYSIDSFNKLIGGVIDDKE
ncbi:Uncharacterised protein [[Clostridium] sordellii]|uniref:hypothetical protein n=1 Tax=Paraclostridium sordellii TaxID=1505 RepID=UPI0005E0CB80|nr:hypothetical protein [Paeniclostridium sordellii]CEQ32282.1 Uncharacterised protein [[Clostridium] sordellii] [Paeniclostridium sordellii]